MQLPKSELKVEQHSLGDGGIRLELKKKAPDYAKFALGYLIFLPFFWYILISQYFDKHTYFKPISPFLPILVSLVIGGLAILYLYRNQLSDYFSHLSFSQKEYIEKFESFLINNHLYHYDDEEITYAVSLDFYDNGSDLKVVLNAYGSDLTQKTMNLDDELESLLKKQITDKRMTDFNTTYYFKDYLYAQDGYPYLVDNEIYFSDSFYWNIDKSPHALIAGGTGGGKTYFLFSLIKVFYEDKSKLFICDPKRSELYNLRFLLDDEKVVFETESNKIARNIRLAKEMMESRYERYDLELSFGKNYRDFGDRPVVVILDEIGALLSGCDKKTKDEINANLRQIIFKGRQAGVFVILSTQKPDAETIATDIRDQLGMRAVLGNLSDDGFRMVFGKSDGMTYQKSSPGNGYIFIDHLGLTRPQRFKAPYIEDIYDLF